MKLGQYDEHEAHGIKRVAYPATLKHIGKATEMV